ncbi:MAG: AraC family transcriptional regulator [Bacteroidota bacterium]
MKARIYTSDLQELLVENHYPNGFRAQDSTIIERKYSKDTFFGKMFYTELFFEGFRISYGDLALHRDTQFFMESDIETVEMQFTISGDMLTKDQETGMVFEQSCNQHNVFYHNGFRGTSEWSHKTRMQGFGVNLMPSFFEKYLPDNAEAFENFKNQLYYRRTSLLSQYQLQITPKMFLIIKEILNSKRQEVYKKIFIEAKVIELLMLQLEQISEHKGDFFCSLKKTDIEKMHQVKEIILNNLSRPYSLISLAKQVGTNEYTLKKGFKEVFGTTVFGFWNELKMQESKNLLLEQKLSVSEVSERIGYKRPQYFSAAFKKYFGFSPSQLTG